MGVHVHIANVRLLGLLEKTGSRRLMVFSGKTSPAMSHITGAFSKKRGYIRKPLITAFRNIRRTAE